MRPAPPASSSPGLRSSARSARSRWPSQSSSFRSASHASAPSEPSTSSRRLFFRPALTCETTAAPAQPPSSRNSRMCAKSSVVIGASTRSTSSAAANVSTSPAGRCRTGNAVVRSAKTALDPPAGDPLRKVHPVRADVGDRPQRAALLRLEAPVPVGRIEQPVLEVAAVDVPDLAQRARRHERPRLVRDRVEAEVEVRAVHEPALRRELEQLGRLRRGRRQRLLADDVLAGRQRIAHLPVMEMVRRRHVDDVHPLVGEQRLVALVRGSEPLRLRALGRRRARPHDLHAQPSQRLDMDGADEARARRPPPSTHAWAAPRRYFLTLRASGENATMWNR